MRKLHKEQILELLKTLNKAIEETRQLFSKKQISAITNVLADCQDGATNIVEFVDQTHGKGTKAAQLVNDFSEMLYKASTELNGKNANDGFIKPLKKQISAIIDSISELKPKTEIVFFPYKASMWDSLESIYLAAKENPDCEAYVIPIPYFDKNSDGSLGQMHYEIEDYPKSIPLVDYRKYNIEERRPDAIFIHNPYDDFNIVTSVHPNFYSQRLRDFTDNLVYVPYFVLDGVNIQEHFCALPACIFAHKVVVQTEEERKIYVREYNKFSKEHGIPIGVEKNENKFLPLGSPKLDKAINSKREDYEIPEEWEKLINNADGTHKKVVFYNTSIGALLQYSVDDNKPSNKYLQKIREVFEFFKKQNDAVLLWRPHPLLENTIKIMRPWLEQEYAEIVSEFKNDGYGIYDCSENLNRAVALSDMYYGDGSSVTRLFEVSGKAVLHQLFEPAFINGLYADGNFVWSMNNYNLIYKHDKQSNKTECMGVSFVENHSAIINIVENNEKLYFAPFYKNSKISIFDKKEKIFERIDFKDDGKFDRKFINVLSYKNFVYFIPHDFPAIMKLNTHTNEIEYFSQWVNSVSKLQTLELKYEFWKNLMFFGSCIVNEEIAIVIHRANAVMFFNMETGNYEIKNIGEKPEQYYDICFDGQNYYLSLFYENYILKWNRQTNKTSKIKFPDSFSRKADKRISFKILCDNEHIWLLPQAANNAYKINVNTEEFTELPELIEFFEDKNIDWFYNRLFAKGDFIYASTLNKGIVEYNIKTRELKSIGDFEEYNNTIFALKEYLKQDVQDLKISSIPSNWSIDHFLT